MQRHINHMPSLSNKYIGHIPQPVVLMDGSAPEFERWMELQDVIVLHPTHSFLNKIRNESSLAHPSLNGKGVSPWMRLIIPDVVENLRLHPIIQINNLSTNFVLYTDTDIIFTKEFTFPPDLQLAEEPRFMAHAIQGDHHRQQRSRNLTNHTNSGVSIINTNSMLNITTKLHEMILTQKKYVAYDQGALHKFLRSFLRI